MMRINLKLVLVALCIVVVITLMIYNPCNEGVQPRWDRRNINGQSQADPPEEIDCYINQEYSISCRKEGDEVYLPFSFLYKYFEVYGSLSTVDGVARFDWAHSYGKVNYPKATYDPHGIFMYFENYNVEMRDRVKCISAADGVPVSTQWESQGYFYPTQIAQFGLSHYSKNLTEPQPRRKVVEDGEGTTTAEWVIPENSSLTRSFDAAVRSHVLRYATSSNFDGAVHLPLDHVLDLILSVDLFIRPNVSLIVTLQHRETKTFYHLNYIVADVLVTVQDENIYYGLGVPRKNKWKRLTRDLLVDLQKGLQLQMAMVGGGGGGGGSDQKKKKLRRTEIRLTGIAFHGIGSFDNLTLSTSEHIAHFYDAAEWLVRHQNATTGGWPNPVKRKLGSGFAELPSGWYSAMGQGHAISLLARAHVHSRGSDPRYLKAAIAGLKPFQVPATQGGVAALFMDKYTWYEEYPTTPPSFILNGFIYSLLGLYDLNSTVGSHVGLESDAGVLLEEGLLSLRKMLLMFDTGSGTSYDLRHLTLGIAPNLARWDYHVTHVNQLLLMATIVKDPLFEQTAKRWQGYMSGKRAQHN